MSVSMHTVVTEVGQRIRSLRKTANLSQAELASRVGTTANTISRWETGAYSPSLSDLEEIATSLGTDVASLIPSRGLSGWQADLLNAVGALNASDVQEVIRYAHFRRVTALK